MRTLLLGSVVAVSCAGLVVLAQVPGPRPIDTVQESLIAATSNAQSVLISSSQVSDLRAWDSRIKADLQDGSLRLRRAESDSLLPGRVHERFEQYYNEVPVFGGGLTRQSALGQTVSVFGALYQDIQVDTEPDLSATAAADVVREASQGDLMRGGRADLVVLPVSSGSYALAFRLVAGGPRGIHDYFVDAHSGGLLWRLSHIRTQAAVGVGKGVLNDIKKVSATARSGSFYAVDSLRPPTLITYDLKGTYRRAWDVVTGRTPLVASDQAVDSDNNWTDAAVVDAHAWTGFVYDFYYKRFGRKGLSGSNSPIHAIVHGAYRSDYRTVPDYAQDFLMNAFFCRECGYNGEDLMVYGDGLPAGAASFKMDYFSGGLDVVAHELTHGVTDYSSELVYWSESGALSEAFSDMMAVSAEFYWQLPGNGPLKADYTLGEDIMSAIPGLTRSLSDPQSYGDPDHYSRLDTGPGDNYGVHGNSTIASHAFYLAIEGGTNRTSGRSVQGVGAANREQIENAFYRAFTSMLPPGARFSTARAATIQSARDLYGSGNVERAITQAWDAVGVFEQAELAISFSPTPAPGRSTSCGSLIVPCWPISVTLQETAGIGLTVQTATVDFYDETASYINSAAVPFAQYFATCGPGTSRIQPRGKACSSFLVGLGGRRAGWIVFRITGTDDRGTAVSFVSGALTLARVYGAVPIENYSLPGVLKR